MEWSKLLQPKSGPLDWLTRLDELLIANTEAINELTKQLKGREVVIPSYEGEPSTPTPTPTGGYILKMASVKIFDAITPYGTSTTYYPTILADCTEGVESVLIIVSSTCDQALTVQTMGSLLPAMDISGIGGYSIEASQSLAATSAIGLGVDLASNWYPYMGVSIASGSTPPTAGQLNAWVYTRKWVRE